MANLTDLSSATQKLHFSTLRKKIEKKGFKLFTKEEREQEIKQIKLSSPKTKIQEQTQYGPTFRLLFSSGYMVEVLPSFDYDQGVFFPVGKSAIQVKSTTNLNEQLLYMHFIKNEKTMCERLPAIARYLALVFADIPKDSKGKVMKFRKRDKDKLNFGFISQTEGLEEFIDLFDSSLLSRIKDPYSLTHVEEISKTRSEYLEKKSEGKRSISEVRQEFKREAEDSNQVIDHSK